MKLLLLPLQEPVRKSSKKKKKKKKTDAQKSATEKSSKKTTHESKPGLASALPQDSIAKTPQKSVAKKTDTPSQQLQPSFDLFKGHELQTKTLKPVIRESNKEDWFPLLTIFIVFLFSLINVFYHRKFRSFLLSLFKRSSGQANREDNIFAQRLKILLFTLFSLITSSFLYQAGMIYNAKPSKLTGFQFFSVILFIVFFTYIGKILLVRMLGYIFRTEKENADYNNNILLYLNLLSFVLFPVVVLIGFTPGIQVEMLVKTGCVFILAAILFRIGRGYIMAVSNPLLSGFYLFLYLCTLEILPLVVILKLFVDQFL